MLPIEPIHSKESPCGIITEDFNLELPIRGGWGYTMSDACIIDKKLAPASIPFKGVSIEYVFVEKRIYEELIIFRPKGHQFSGIKWKLLKQRTVVEGGSRYDHLIFNVSAFHDKDWEALKSEWEGPNGIIDPDFDREAHDRKRQEFMVNLTREFWFDITSFYGS